MRAPLAGRAEDWLQGQDWVPPREAVSVDLGGHGAHSTLSHSEEQALSSLCT